MAPRYGFCVTRRRLADQADSYIRMLSGYRVEAERMSGD
jgi:hypothetical protein